MRTTLAFIVTMLIVSAVVRVSHLSERDYCVRAMHERYPTATRGQAELACEGLGK